ncbi:MAG: esterase family protein, partial [Lachnospiraceae bacterium]|nr:esterase family protein [Lachnospiraceae bacterium]
GKDWAMEHPGQYAEEELVFKSESPYLLMICSGDKDSVVGTFPKSYHNILTTNGVNHIWWEIPGSDHGDPAISSGIYNFCKSIFKN